MSEHAQPPDLQAAQKELSLRIFLILAALFIASLVACNLIFRKFFQNLLQFFRKNMKKVKLPFWVLLVPVELEKVHW